MASYIYKNIRIATDKFGYKYVERLDGKPVYKKDNSIIDELENGCQRAKFKPMRYAKRKWIKRY